MEEYNNVILFDGACNFRSKRRNNNIKFASLKSSFTKSILPKRLINVSEFGAIHLMSKERLFEKSSVILKISQFLKITLHWTRIFLIIPKFIRNFVY